LRFYLEIREKLGNFKNLLKFFEMIYFLVIKAVISDPRVSACLRTRTSDTIQPKTTFKRANERFHDSPDV